MENRQSDRICRNFFERPNLHILKWVCARISRKEDGENSVLAGSGVLFKMKGDFYVLTAAHCMGESLSSDDYSKFTVSLGGVDDMNEEFKVIGCEGYCEEDDKDYALLKINFNPSGSMEFNYDRQIKFVGSDIREAHDAVATFGYRKGDDFGEAYKLERKSLFNYRIAEGIQASGLDLSDLEGLSGSGIFTQYGDVLYCVGFVKGYPTGRKTLDDVSFRRIPELPDDAIWRNSFECYQEHPIESLDVSIPQIEYYKVWRQMLHLLSSAVVDKEKYGQLIGDIRCLKERYPWPKSTSIQEAVGNKIIISHFPIRNLDGSLRDPLKNPEWSSNDKKAYALVLADMGQWPGLYQLPETAPQDFRKSPEFVKHFQRAGTITGNFDLESVGIDEDTDEGAYEAIMRAAFSLDFKEMKIKADRWHRSDECFFAKKVILDSLWGQDEYREKLEEVLIKCNHEENNGFRDTSPLCMEEQFVAALSLNLTNDWENKESRLSFDKFYAEGLAFPGEVIRKIAENIDRKEERIRPYGVNILSSFSTRNEESFPSALRVVQYLLNTGLPTSSENGSMVSPEIWYKVFRHIFDKFPLAVIFYTLCYRNDDLTRRCAQEMAFTENELFVDFRSTLPKEFVKCFIDPDTPKLLKHSLIVMVMELLPVVSETEWFDEVMMLLENDFFSGISFENVDERDWPFKLMEVVINETREEANIARLLHWLADRYGRNAKLFRYLVANFHFSKELIEIPSVREDLRRITGSNRLSETYPLFLGLKNNNILYGEWQDQLNEMLAADDLKWTANDRDGLRILSYTLQDEALLAKIRRVVLRYDVWGCGVKENSVDSRDFSYHLEGFADEMGWSNDELDRIFRNMDENLTLIESTMNNSNLKKRIAYKVSVLMLEMKQFIQKYISGYDFRSLLGRIDRNLVYFNGIEQSFEYLLSNDYPKYSHGLELLKQGVDSSGIEKYRDEIGMVIDRISLLHSPGIGESAAFLANLLHNNNYKSEMIKYFGRRLNLMVKSIRHIDFRQFNLHAVFFRRILAQLSEDLALP